MLTNWPVSFWYKFLQKKIFKTGYSDLDLIPIIPWNIFKLHTKKIYTKYDKIWVFEKSPHENYHGEKKSWAEWSGISLVFSKSMPWLDRVYIGSFFNLYMTLTWYHQDEKLYDTSLISTKWEIDETVNFRNLLSCSQINVPHFFGILAPCFQMAKMKQSSRAHEACCNGRQLM